ncbi:hypothetical protein EVAR_100233_1 [Eumeta japonica]|uniref:Uncharacterized protein n=1 Tax=Eumeta variegata TaxID=151549 RepID=A0A4C1ZVP0_EUMVA|nr:hypothetical protein EVAR_100233_1 [Eumeta japonica]
MEALEARYNEHYLEYLYRARLKDRGQRYEFLHHGLSSVKMETRATVAGSSEGVVWKTSRYNKQGSGRYRATHATGHHRRVIGN